MIRCLFFLALFLSTLSHSYSSEFFSYLEDFKNLEMHFLQENPDGKILSGVFSFISPKKFRWEYFAPFPVVLILNGNLITYHDRDLEETSHKILSKDVYLMKFASQFYKIIREKSKYENGKIKFTDVIEDNLVTVVFNAKPVFLESLLILHPDNNKTKIKFFNIVYNKKFGKNLLTEF